MATSDGNYQKFFEKLRDLLARRITPGMWLFSLGCGCIVAAGVFLLLSTISGLWTSMFGGIGVGALYVIMLKISGFLDEDSLA